MKKKKSTGKIILLLTIFILLLNTSLFGGSFKNIKKQVKKYTLSNGMTFIVLERHFSPVVSVHLYVAAGAANESYNNTGISHLLEHMAFKGSKTVGTTDYKNEKEILTELDDLYDLIQNIKYSINPDTTKLFALETEFERIKEKANQFVINNEFIDIFREQGDNGLNAYTSSDATQYISSLPSNRLEFWMSATSDRFLNPVFRQFYKEKNVVMEERRLSLESRPIGKLIEDFCAAAFKAHPYHHSVLGHMSVLKRITRQDVRDYFKRFYTPSNIIVGIVGDVKAKEVFKMAELYFGRIPSDPKPEIPRPTEPEQWGEKNIKVTAKSQPILIVGYHRPDGDHVDDSALSAMANIAGQGRSSWLYKKLVKEDKIAVQVGVFNGFPGDKYANLVAFLAVPAPNHTSKECLDAIDEQIEILKTESVSAQELKKYKRSFRKGLINRMKSNSSMASMLANAEAVSGSWEEIFNQIDEVDAVTAEKITAVAKRYLKNNERTIGEIVPEESGN